MSEEIVVTTKNTPALALGIISLIIGTLAILGGWIPFIGLVAIPLAIIGLGFAGLGLLISLFKGFKGAGMPILGGGICFIGLMVPILMTGSMATAITKTTAEVSSDLENTRVKLDKERKKEEEKVNKDKEKYISKNIKIYDVEAKIMNSLIDGNVPGVNFKIKNEGQRTLNEVEVTFYFKNKENQIIAEKEYNPVLVTEFTFDPDRKPLKPGYIWQMEKGKFYTAKSVPSEWDEGNVDVKITNISFIK